MTGTGPADGARSVAPGTPVSITFSAPVDQNSTQRAVSFYTGTYNPSANPASFTPLTLTSMCAGYWRVRNANTVPLSFTWDIYNSPETRFGVVPASGEAFFYSSTSFATSAATIRTQAAVKPKTARVFVGGQQQNVKAENTAACTTPRTFSWNADNTVLTFTPSPATTAGNSYTAVVSTAALSPSGDRLAQPFVLGFTVADQPTGGSTVGTVGPQGGIITLGNASVKVPAGAVDADVQIRLERLPSPPALVPATDIIPAAAADFQTVGQYRLSASVENFKQPLEVTVPVDVPTSLPDGQVITELYTWDGQAYVKQRIADAATSFQYLLEEPLTAGQGDTGFAAGITFVVGRASTQAISAACAARGGRFNGRYCTFADSTGVGGQGIRAQAVAASYKVLSINVGNASLHCLENYVVKLCSFATEERVAKTIFEENPDIIAIQEAWNDDCKYIPDSLPGVVGDLNPDRVCSRRPRSPGGDTPAVDTPKQLARLIGQNGARYSYQCTPTRDATADRRVANGYECVAVRTSLFEFVEPAGSIPTIQPPCVDGTDNPARNYKGGDTGFQVERVRLKNPVGAPDGAVFDVVNAHMIAPGEEDCRLRQLNALRARYYITGPRGQTPNRLLIAGDFNTDPIKLASVADTRFSGLFSVPGRPFSDIAPVRTAYLLSNPNEVTAYLPTYKLLPIFKENVSLDHVLSNFADGSCTRGGRVSGLDHLRTRCTLTGFDSGTVSALMSLWDTASDGGVNYAPWSTGTVNVIKRGVLLNYARLAQPSPGRYVNFGVPAGVGFKLEYQACRLGSTQTRDPVTVDPGQILFLGELRFAEFIPINCK